LNIWHTGVQNRQDGNRKRKNTCKKLYGKPKITYLFPPFISSLCTPEKMSGYTFNTDIFLFYVTLLFSIVFFIILAFLIKALKKKR